MIKFNLQTETKFIRPIVNMFVSYKCYTNLHIIVCQALLIGSILNNHIHIIVKYRHFSI